jgi:DHA3 family macrolide efflux protein-like MFS transporter
VATAAIGIAILALLVKIPAGAAPRERAPGAGQYFRDIGAGLSYAKKNAFIKRFLLLAALFSFLSAPAANLVVLHVSRKFGGEIQTLFGLSLGAEGQLAAISVAFFAGMILGGLVMGAWGGFKNKARTMALAVFLLGLFTVVMGLLDNLWLYLLCVFMTGVGMGFFNPPITTLLQTVVAPDYMGRVFSLFSMISNVMMPLSLAIFGPLGDVISLNLIITVSGALQFLIGFWFLLDKTLLNAGAAKSAVGENAA